MSTELIPLSSYYQAVKEEQHLQQCLEDSEHNRADKILRNGRQALQDEVEAHNEGEECTIQVGEAVYC